ncbi:MAG: ATP synthase F1 subunit delta [Candidatus Hatepunaea meridiana]|nr:ATP synthase F1 subunit delta [Candidatus Hatepunaea meridiana]
MSGGSLARRYVQPLFEVAQENNQIDRINNDLELLDRTLSESEELRGFLVDPSIIRQLKKGLIEKLFTEFSHYSMNFVKVVIDKNRPEVLKSAYSLFMELLNIHRGITPGIVESAVPLEDADFEKVKTTLELRLGSKLVLERRVDPSLLGGVRAQVGNTVIDGSLRGRLNKLKATLIN